MISTRTAEECVKVQSKNLTTKFVKLKGEKGFDRNINFSLLTNNTRSAKIYTQD